MIEQHSYSGDYTNRYKFNGKELDEETGFYYYGARYYSPKFSIWLSVDPLAEKMPSFSPYNYCGNNPISNIDPDGRYFFDLFGSSSHQRRQMRAERFAEKVGGIVVSNLNGNPSVNYNFENRSDGTLSFRNKSNFGDFTSWKNAKETLVGFEKSLSSGGSNYGNGDGEYTGVQGMREFGEDASKASTYFKLVRVVVTSSSEVVGPEVAPIGIGIYNYGSAMDDVSAGLQITADFLQGKDAQGYTRVASFAVGKVADGVIDKNVSGEVTQTILKHRADAYLGEARDGIIKNLDKKDLKNK